MKYIKIKGARENNLKNLNINIPKNKFVVVTGVSGSGKSTLAFNTIYQESERRFVESLSSYARNFISSKEKPDVDSIEGLSPSISIDQKSTSHNPRSTVGTVTEVYDYLRLLFSRCADVYCKTHNIKIEKFNIDKIVDSVTELQIGTKIEILSPIIINKKGEHKNILQNILKDGFVKVYIDGKLYNLDEDEINLNKNNYHDIDIVISRFILKEGDRSKIVDDINTSIKYGNGFTKIKYNDKNNLFSINYACPICGYSINKLEPRMFSFNSPQGACIECNGLGYKNDIKEELILDYEKNLKEGGVIPFKGANDDNIYIQTIEAFFNHFKIDANKKFKDLTKDEKNLLLYGTKEVINYKVKSSTGRVHEFNTDFEGVVNNLKRRYLETSSDFIREWIEGYMVDIKCDKCHGNRLNEDVLSVYIDGKNIADLCNMSITNLYDFFQNLKLSDEKMQIAKLAIKEIKDRLSFLIDVGLDYLTLSRSANTLSGGESQRIRLATQIGSQLSGIIYVLDEPSIGLHQKDNDKLIESLFKMRDLDNTLIVVEHDLDTIRACDHVIDIGPTAGSGGGYLVGEGPASELSKFKDSITGKYLTGEYKIEMPQNRVKNNKFIEIIGAKENNLKNINVKFQLGSMVCVTGVSGSGKSTLVNSILLNSIKKEIYNDKKVVVGDVKKIKGLEHINRVIEISQQPIGKTPRSNPATYTKVFDEIRDLFALTQDAKIKGYDKGHFSFNNKGGRCEACCGDGVKKISMHFLPDVYVPCEVCNGKRYTKDVLEVKYNGKSIYDVLEMSVEEAYKFFNQVYKIKDKLQTLMDVGLSYIKLGQNSTTLSGGEAQRIKLASELSKTIKSDTLYLLDEPTTGLHIHDIKKLLNVLYKIRDNGASLIIIEHNLDVIKCADYIVDLGYTGGEGGGHLLYNGPFDDFLNCKDSDTAIYLNKLIQDETRRDS